MNTVTEGIKISPVNMENRKEIGVQAGDTVRVHQKIVDEKGKARIQVFEGLVLARKHGSEPGATFTVRKMVDGIGVEKIFPLYSPLIDKIEIIRRSKVRRAKLYYIREKVAREVKRQMRRMQLMSVASESETETAARAEEDAKKVEEEAAKAAEDEAKAEADAKAAEEAKQAEAPEATEAPAEEVEEETKKAEEKAEEPKEETPAEEKKEEVEEEKKD